MLVMGSFILLAWSGFNAGATRCMGRACRNTAGVVAWNTTLSGCTATLDAYFFSCSFHSKFDVGFLCNGPLGGLVAITAGCDMASEPASMLVGFTAGLFVFPFGLWLTCRMNIDDPVDAAAVYLGCGMSGTIAVAFLRPDCSALDHAGGGMPAEQFFCMPSHSVWRQLVAQLWCVFTILWWVTVCSGTVWLTFACMELAWSLEVHEYDAMEKLIDKMCSGTPPCEGQDEIASQWKKVVARCPSSRWTLRRHGPLA